MEETADLAGGQGEAFAILAPHGMDARLIGGLCERLGAAWFCAPDAQALCRSLSGGTIAWIVTEEALSGHVDELAACLRTQPAWSDLPVLILTASRRGEGPSAGRELLFDRLGHVTLLQRPLRAETLLRALGAACRTRQRQHRLQTQMAALQDATDHLELRVEERTRELHGEMARRHEAERSFAESQRREAIGQLTGGVAHDFNNLLQVIRASAAAIERSGDNPSIRQRAVDSIQRTVTRGASLTQQLLAYASRQPMALEEVDLTAHVAGLKDFLERALRGDITFHLVLDPDLRNIRTDAGQLDAALLNLAVNARDAMPSGGSLSLSLSNGFQESAEHGVAPGPCVLIEMTDTGTGMSEDTLSRASEPFFTTKKSSGGTGLGLSQVYGFARQSGGDILIRSKLGQGTAVTLRLPAVEPSRNSGVKRTTRVDRPVMPWRHVLVVDDNEDVAEATCQMLESLGFDTAHVASADEALAMPLDNIDFVVSDVIMPGRLDGIGLATRLKARRPCLPVLLVSGYVGSPERVSGSEFLLLSKPYTESELLGAVHELARRHSVESEVMEEGASRPAKKMASRSTNC